MVPDLLPPHLSLVNKHILFDLLDKVFKFWNFENQEIFNRDED